MNNLLQKNNIAKRFKKKKIEQKKITEVLWAGYGKTRNELRTVLSLSEFPLHLYICINEEDIEYLRSGLYEYKTDIHNLKKVDSNGLKEEMINMLGLKGTIPAIFIITADKEKYEQERENIFFELGEMTANILLKTRELKLKVKFIDKFESERIINRFELDDEHIIMILLIGK